ncbi:MAG: VTT domain-containing protein [Candidatus Aminicenantes bacterium]|nr:MAG: VTT domain-containing protein [Candidatus Aminicenantes bacterium]
MSRNKSLDSSPLKGKKSPASKIKLSIFILEIVLIVLLLVLWFSSEEIKRSKNLWVLFFYSFPSEFLIAIVPHEPVLLYFGKFYQPLTVAIVAVISTVMTEALNYSAFKFVTDSSFFKKIQHRKFVTKIVDLFNKAPFIALLVAGFTPIPFYPFRFLVVLAHYPWVKYLLAVFLSRTPRFFIFALLGHMIKIPDYLLVVIFFILILVANIPLLRRFLKNRQKK